MDKRILIGGAVVVAVVIALVVFFSGKKVNVQTVPGSCQKKLSPPEQ